MTRSPESEPHVEWALINFDTEMAYLEAAAANNYSDLPAKLVALNDRANALLHPRIEPTTDPEDSD